MVYFDHAGVGPLRFLPVKSGTFMAPGRTNNQSPDRERGHGEHWLVKGVAVRILRWTLTAALAALLVACGGGGGGSGDSGPSITFSKTTFDFDAASPAAAMPATQKIMATVSHVKSGTLYILVQNTAPDLVTVSNFAVTSATTGEASIDVSWPAKLGMGTRVATITVIACMNDPNCNSGRLHGTPQAITVNYRIGSPVQINTVMPAVVDSNASGRVVLRGSGLADVTGVEFGATAATSVQVVNATEIRAQFPGLAAGTYPVTLKRGASASAFGANLTAVDPVAFGPDAWTFPAPPGIAFEVSALQYDALTRSVLVAARAYIVGQSLIYDPSQNAILRYTHSNGTWQLTGNRPFPNLRALAFTPDRLELLAASDQAVERLDPVTLQTLAAATKPAVQYEFIKGLAVTNDGNAIVTTGMETFSGATTLYLYSLKDASFAVPRLIGTGPTATNWFDYGSPAASGDGSMAVVHEGSIAPPMYRYRPDSGQWEKSSEQFYPGANLVDNSGAASIDETGTHLLLPEHGISQRPPVAVLNGNLGRTGVIGGMVEAQAINRAGTRAYTATLETYPTDCAIHAYDLTAAPASGTDPYPEITGGGYPIARECVQPEVLNARMMLSQDDHTLFVAGRRGVQVIPLP